MADEEKRAFPIVVTGHIDHGKSTLIGRLLYDCGALPQERYEEMRQSSIENGRHQEEFAFVLDSFEEERRRGITIDTAQIFFRAAGRPYVIIDAPGHREFIRNMVTGASYAEAAILIVDAGQGIRDQTLRHLRLLHMVGIRDICVVVNKMDAIGYEHEVFGDLCTDIDRLFASLALTPHAVIPVSALTGENMTSRSSVMPWYSGPILVEALGSFEFRPLEERPLRFPVQDVYVIDEETVVVGRVESGSLNTGMKMQLLPAEIPVTVGAVRKYPHKDIGSASYEDAVGLVVKGDNSIRRGDVFVSGERPQTGTRFQANLFWFQDTYKSNDPVILRCATQEVRVRISLEEVFDPGDGSEARNDDRIVVGEIARCSIDSERPLIFDKCSLIPEMGRFVIERDGTPVGGGIIV